MKAFCIRLAELLLVNCALSAIVAGGFVSGILLNTSKITTLLILCADALFLIIQFIRSRALCIEAQDMRIYFGVNLSATAVFAAINFVLMKLLAPKPYTWLFITAKILSIPTNYAVSNVWSAIFFQCLAFAVVFLAPLHRKTPDPNNPIPLDRENFKLNR